MKDLVTLADRDITYGAGSTNWYFPDADLPWPDSYGPFEGHESLLVLNVSGQRADLLIDLYWTDREPTLGISAGVEAQRIICLHPPYGDSDAQGKKPEVPVRTQYAIRVRSTMPVICQYGRIECRPSLGMYTMMGWSGASNAS